MSGSSSIATSQGSDDADTKQRAKAHLRAVAEAVLAAEILNDPRWSELAILFSISDSGKNFGNSGYAYGEDGAWWAVSFPVSSVKEPILNLLSDLQDPVPSNLVRILFQYDRKTKRAKILPEFNNPDRWLITPVTAQEIMAKIKPNFSQNSEIG